MSDLIEGTYASLKSRGITQETCEFWSYQVGDDCHIANYKDPKGQRIAQKIRREGKKFSWTGDAKHPYFYGQWLWGSGKSVVITEGEIDALSVSQAFRNKWPVVSLKDGAQSAVKCVQANYEWLDGFERVVICFDQDDPGHLAAEEAAAALPIGKAFVMTLPRKDANEVLVQDGPEVLVKAFWNAKPYRPDGIISGSELTVSALKEAAAVGYELPYPKLQEMMLGLRKGELTLLTAGTGIGKSSLARELAYYLHQTHGCSIGNVFLEESTLKTGQALVAIHNNVPLGKLRADPSILTDEQWDDAFEKVIKERMWFFKHFGSLESDNLLSKIRYLGTVCGADFVILDHISIVVSGQEGSGEGERRDIDRLMTKLRSLVEETGIGVIAIVHLNKPEGKAHEEGGRVTLSNLRGSGALKQLSDNVIAMERNQQAEGEERMLNHLRVLKCRETGNTGEADTLCYSTETGRLGLAMPVGL